MMQFGAIALSVDQCLSLIAAGLALNKLGPCSGASLCRSRHFLPQLD